MSNDIEYKKWISSLSGTKNIILDLGINGGIALGFIIGIIVYALLYDYVGSMMGIAYGIGSGGGFIALIFFMIGKLSERWFKQWKLSQ